MKIKEREAADWFVRQVDLMLARHGAASETAPIECVGDLQLARRLAEADFTALRGVPAVVPKPAAVSVGGIRRWLLRPAPIAAAAAALALIFMQCTYPGGVPGLAKTVLTMVSRTLELGPHTKVIMQTPEDAKRQAASVPQELRDKLWIVTTDAGRFGGPIPPGVPNIVSKFAAYETARGTATFAFKIPRYMVAGFVLSDVYVGPGGYMVVSIYRNASGASIVVSQCGTIKSPAMPNGGLTAITIGTSSPFAVIASNGLMSAWFADTRTLAWEAGNVASEVSGGVLSLENALRIQAGMK